MKRRHSAFYVFLVILTVSLIIPAGALGANGQAEPPKVYIDGDLLGSDVPPLILQDRTMVPMRAIFEALGAQVKWNGETRTVTAEKESTTIVLQIGNSIAYKNGTPIIFDVSPLILQDRTLVPIRFVSEALGADVEWDGENRHVLISTIEGGVPAILKAADFLPLIRDIHMKYKGEGNEFAPFETYADYVKDGILQLYHSNGGTSSAIVYKVQDGSLKKVFQQAETYYMHDFTQRTNMDETLLKEPIAKGTSWTLADGSLRTITDTAKQLNLSAGNFTAVEVTTDRADSTQKEYYAKGIGLIKTEFSAKDSSYLVTSELELIQANVPRKQKIRFFFPEFNMDRIVFVEREIHTYTNQDMNKIFEEQLKIIPVNSELTRTLTVNTKVWGYTIDENTGILTVNISSNFVNEMNAGTSLESMLLESIANTFGNYYQKDKVKLRLDGQNYESGHILFEEDDYMDVYHGGTAYTP